MRRALTVLALTFSLPLTVAACLWDRDTPADEARGMPEVVAVLTGRFVRNPPLFYEMRLARVTTHLQARPEDLEAYDDAAVASDRLGRGDEAIAWMEKKREILDKLDAALPDVKEQWYRYHANLGTFLVHRWARQGSDRSRIDEVKSARDEIARALEINPYAHFGRERYQLMALDWIVNPPRVDRQYRLPNLLGWNAEELNVGQTDPKEADDAVRGLAGLIVLGNAWESVDIFAALEIALERDSLGYDRSREGGRNSLAYFAWLRCLELIKAGKGSMLPDAPKGERLGRMLNRPDFIPDDSLLKPAYQELRAEADAWHAARIAFMESRLKTGRHPDTDPDFWQGYTEKPAPGLPIRSVPEVHEARRDRLQLIALTIIIGIPALIFSSIATWLVVRFKKRRGRRSDSI